MPKASHQNEHRAIIDQHIDQHIDQRSDHRANQRNDHRGGGSVTQHRPPKVVQCVAGSPRELTDAVAASMATYRSGGTPLPIFVVGPEVDPEAAEAEVERLGYPESTAVLMRTSGSTTGTGKIVAHSWDSLIASATATHSFLGGPGVWASDLPLHHVAGFQTVVRSVLAGLTPISFNLKDPVDVREALASADEQTYVSLVPTQLLRVLEAPPLLHSLARATFLVGGAGTAGALLERARGAGLNVVTSYGMTETGGGCFYDGLPIGDTEALLKDGRVSIRGSVVALGYLGDVDPDAFASDQTPRIHRTQDAGQFTAEGRLEILGRIDDAITTGGLTVMPRLIEDATVRATGAGAIVVGIPDEKWGEAVVAVLDRPADPQALRTAIKAELGAGWAPTHVMKLAELAEFDGWGKTWPITSSGKVNRRELARAVRVYFQR